VPAKTTHIPFPSCFDFEPTTKDEFLSAVRKAHKRGDDIVVTSPKARDQNGRKAMIGAMRSEGLEPEIAAILGWGTTNPNAKMKEERPRMESAEG